MSTSTQDLKPRVVGIFICPVAGERMQEVLEVEAIAGAGLKGDRYATRKGSFTAKVKGLWQRFMRWLRGTNRQVTLIASEAFEGTSFEYHESRRNIIVKDVELMWLIGKEFQVGAAKFRGVKYCDPCNRPNTLCGKSQSFKEAFFDRGGLIAEVVKGGLIRVGNPIIPPPKGY
ncbi:MAG: hypothetical protein Q7S10_00895 [bacterium]|nr:hypothetical protein [bacterium]